MKVFSFMDGGGETHTIAAVDEEGAWSEARGNDLHMDGTEPIELTCTELTVEQAEALMVGSEDGEPVQSAQAIADAEGPCFVGSTLI